MRNFEIIHKIEEHRFVTIVEGVEAHVQYQIENNCFDIRHTIVPKAIGGQGIAAALVQKAFTWAQTKNYQLSSSCSYATVWAKRHQIDIIEKKNSNLEDNCCI